MIFVYGTNPFKLFGKPLKEEIWLSVVYSAEWWTKLTLMIVASQLLRTIHVKDHSSCNHVEKVEIKWGNHRTDSKTVPSGSGQQCVWSINKWQQLWLMIMYVLRQVLLLTHSSKPPTAIMMAIIDVWWKVAAFSMEQLTFVAHSIFQIAIIKPSKVET